MKRKYHEYKRPKGSAQRKRSSGESRSSSGTDQVDSGDDRHGHLVFKLGDNLTPNYKILAVLGEGTFGKVLECWDRSQKLRVAIKVIRAIEKYRDAAKIEIEVLEHLGKHDVHANVPVIRLLSWFSLKGHICMVFEKLGLSIFDFMKKNAYHSYPFSDIVSIAQQLLLAVAYMHRLSLVHTDLKPENILFVDSEYVTPASDRIRQVKSSLVKLIDFGSSTFENAHHTSIVSTRHYRAPEIILGMGWSYPCDIWSIGCIMIELYSGDTLFQTHDDVEHLAMMQKVLGTIPVDFVPRADSRGKEYFDKYSKLRWPERVEHRSSSIRHVDALKPLQNLIKAEHTNFVDLLSKMLIFEPERRITAKEALEHPFFGDCLGNTDLSINSTPNNNLQDTKENIVLVKADPHQKDNTNSNNISLNHSNLNHNNNNNNDIKNNYSSKDSNSSVNASHI